MLKKISLIFLSLLLIASKSYAQTNKQVTLEQEIGQMLMIGFNGDKLIQPSPIVADIQQQRIGGVILFDYNFQTKTFAKNIKNPTQLKKLTQQLQLYTKQAAQKNHNHLYPLLIGIDYEGGEVNRLKPDYGFPQTKSAAYLGHHSLTTTKYYANIMADTLKQENINLDFAPVLDVNINPNNPVIAHLQRSFSSNPYGVIQHAAIFAKTFKQNNILCVYKHFPGHGDSTTDSHKGFVDETNTWRPIELIPYIYLLKKPYSCNMVMVAHIVNKHLDPQGHPATLSYKIITGILRNQLNFNGIIVSDDMQMKAITKYYTLKKAIPLAINAGIDILVFGNQLEYQPTIAKQCITIIKQDVKQGIIPRSRIDDAYNKIIKLKLSLDHNIN